MISNRDEVIAKSIKIAEQVTAIIVEGSKEFRNNPDAVSELIYYITHVLAEINIRQYIPLCSFAKLFSLESKINFHSLKEVVDKIIFELFDANKYTIDNLTAKATKSNNDGVSDA